VAKILKLAYVFQKRAFFQKLILLTYLIHFVYFVMIPFIQKRPKKTSPVVHYSYFQFCLVSHSFILTSSISTQKHRLPVRMHLYLLRFLRLSFTKIAKLPIEKNIDFSRRNCSKNKNQQLQIFKKTWLKFHESTIQISDFRFTFFRFSKSSIFYVFPENFLERKLRLNQISKESKTVHDFFFVFSLLILALTFLFIQA